jgi:hypothetical protein
MRIATTVSNWVVRVLGVFQIVLGILIWTGNALTFTSLHITSGLVLVLALWVLAGIALAAGVAPGLSIVVFLWGVLVIVFGLVQTRLLVGDLHWIIRVLHLLIGLSAIGQAEGLAQRIKQRSRAGAPAPAA